MKKIAIRVAIGLAVVWVLIIVIGAITQKADPTFTYDGVTWDCNAVNAVHRAVAPDNFIPDNLVLNGTPVPYMVAAMCAQQN